MKIPKNGGKEFESCPPFEGRCVCVDVTPLEKRDTKFGPKMQFKLVFEVDKAKSDGKPYCVWSKWLTPSSHEKAALRILLKDWFGRDMTETEWETFDTEQLILRPGRCIIINERDGDDVFANIKLLLPHREQDGPPLKPSGTFVRKQDRDKNGSSYAKTEEQPSVNPETAWMLTKVHVGKHRGHELRDLTEDAVVALAENWLPLYRPGGEKVDHATADDKRLIAAIEKFIVQKNAADKAKAEQTESDDVPY